MDALEPRCRRNYAVAIHSLRGAPIAVKTKVGRGAVDSWRGGML